MSWVVEHVDFIPPWGISLSITLTYLLIIRVGFGLGLVLIGVWMRRDYGIFRMVYQYNNITINPTPIENEYNG